MDTLTISGQKEGETLEDAIKRLVGQGKDPLLPHLSKDSIEALYSFAFGAYESGHYEKAMHFFRFLTLIDIHEKRHWMGLGASYQMQKLYKRALQCYGFAALLNENDPLSHWHAAECFIAIGNVKKAKDALISAELTAKKQPKRYHTLLEKIKLIKKGSKKIKKK